MLAYGAVFLSMQYVYDVLYSFLDDQSTLRNIGFRPFDKWGAYLAVQCLVAVPLAVAGRIGSADLSNGFLLHAGG